MSLANSAVFALPTVLLEPLVRATLAEDLGRAGDITSDAIIGAQVQSELFSGTTGGRVGRYRYGAFGVRVDGCRGGI